MSTDLGIDCPRCNSHNVYIKEPDTPIQGHDIWRCDDCGKEFTCGPADYEEALF